MSYQHFSNRLYNHSDPQSYLALDTFLRGGRGGEKCDTRKLANNTYAERRSYGHAGAGAIAVRLHATDVLTFYANGDVRFTTGGWQTVTTKDRINRFAPSGWAVYSERGDWRLYGPDNFECAFQDGITVSGRSGKVRREFVRAGAKLDAHRIERRKREARLRGRERRAEKYNVLSDWLAPLGEVFSTAHECSDMPPADARIAYHFVLAAPSWRHETAGTPITQNGSIPVRVGQTLRVLADPVPCERGLHASDEPIEAYRYCQGPILCRVAVWGMIRDQGDKLVAQYRHVLAMANVHDIIADYTQDLRPDAERVRAFNGVCIARLNRAESHA